MSHIITGEPVARFVSDQLGFGLCPPYTALGIATDEGDIIAGVIFNNFEGADVHITVAGKGWTRAFMRAVGDYVFGQLQCERMTITTEQPAVAMLGTRLGGQIEGRLRNHFGPGKDGLVVGVLKDEYRWYRPNVPALL